ncbi:PD-(D/E)XK nuclease family protein [Patescibacteria group bacterium]
MLKELIDKFYLDQQKTRDQIHFYITDAGKCPRAVFFKFKKAPREKISARVLRLFEKGEYLHRNIINILIRLGIVVSSEIKIPAQEIISGRADVIISLDNELYVVDIKSMNSMIFRKLTSPKEENVYQLQLYLHYFNIKKGILLYIDKDQQSIKEFLVNYDKGLVKSLIKDFQDLKTKIDSDTIPPQMLDYPANWQCRYCQFKEICSVTGAQSLNWNKFKKKIEAQTS